MDYRLEGRDILYNDEQLGPYPVEKLPRAERVTNIMESAHPERKSEGDNAFKSVMKNPKTSPLVRAAAKRGKREPLTKSLMDVREFFFEIPRNPNPVADKKAPIPDDPRVRARHFKCLGYFLGADQVGICEVPDYAVYSTNSKGEPIGLDYKYAIVLSKRKHPATCFASDGHDWIFDPCSHQTYNELFHWTETIANYIRRLGYEAKTSNFRNYTTVMTSLLLAAGFGESGRMGLCVNPFYGPNFKAAAVLTNIELECDSPIDFGLQEYCKDCGICAENCVSGAISLDNEKIDYNGYLKYKIDYERCATLCFVNDKGGICGRCANICPWNRPESDPEYFRNWDGNLDELYETVNARAAHIREQGLPDIENASRKWWFDLCYDENGELIIPRSTKIIEK